MATKRSSAPNPATKVKTPKAKTPATTGGAERFAEPHEVRTFVHRDGRRYTLEVAGCRVLESWSDKRGGSNVSTRPSDDEAHAFAHEKAKKLVREGYVEGPRTKSAEPDLSVDVVEMLRAERDALDEIIYDFQPVPKRQNVFAMANVSVAEWLLTSDDRTQAIRLTAVVWGSPLDAAERARIADAILDALEPHRRAVLDDRTTPLRVLPLKKPIGRFEQLVVLSPAAANEGEAFHRVFPAFRCEVMGNETVALADARCSGRGCIPYANWARAPHPVVDLAHLKKPTDEPKFLVYDPGELDRHLSPKALGAMKGAAILARNHAGEVRRFERGAAPPDAKELRRFFGFDD